eukprot:Hpha_TRINITY_DN17332_c0_g1::TRINITY_DN17332_c0_g1_i1::g.137850::m.137850
MRAAFLLCFPAAALGHPSTPTTPAPTGGGGGLDHPCVAITPAGMIDIRLMQSKAFELQSWPEQWMYNWVFGWCAEGEKKDKLVPKKTNACPSSFGDAKDNRAVIYLGSKYGSRGVDCVWPFSILSKPMTWTRSSRDDPSDTSSYSVQFELRGDPPSTATFPAATSRFMHVTLNCNTEMGNKIESTSGQSQRGIEQKGSGAQGDSLHYYAEFETGWACPGAKLKPPSEGGDSSHWGMYALIAFGCAIVVYLSAGVAYNYKYKEARGADVIPNREFWGSLPGLVWDGMCFTGRGVRRLVRGKDDGYAEV